MAKKGQKFNKINLETKLEICRKHFEEYVPETPLAKEYDLPIGTIRYIFNNYKKGILSYYNQKSSIPFLLLGFSPILQSIKRIRNAKVFPSFCLKMRCILK